ncbi:uncharacterized protein M421DRAFT_89106 [Didymella exigua CBS 183.55]|uniref:Mid2 domain-containing protein n=1 Tax=Didymella exigua CBS 183.55 TaxID=1150837 RepID=A0A6A5RZI9_9PLEO|nr:uncharacterized protein M421DRAFT_89106 [Didymella exigua CBS 183.55]KAF1932750.1 hypothetical protein M421DRAFT_89106 [Didymella exigua CBS 183.55]
MAKTRSGLMERSCHVYPTSSISAPSTTPSINSSPSGLSTGAKAGIGVGAAAAGLLFITVVVFLVWRRRRRARDVHCDPHHDVVPGTQQTGPSTEGPQSPSMTFSYTTLGQ